MMSNPLKQQWQSLTQGRPGHRFQARYEAGKKSRARAGAGFKFLRVARFFLAVGALAIGVVLVFIPGPAILFFLLAGSLLAAESLRVARALDWAEVQVRTGAKGGKRFWRRLHMAGKVAVSSFACAAAMGCAYLAYHVVAR